MRAAIILGLGRARAAAARLGSPERAMPPSAHIAGTNGKGSTLAFMVAMLEASGAATHYFASPHLIAERERVVLAGATGATGATGAIGAKPVAQALWDAAKARVRAVSDSRDPLTPFEIDALAAMTLFAATPADALVLETGMGARLDVTRIAEGVGVVVLTPIARDHEAWLGKSLAAIATEKAGAMRPGVPCVSARQVPSVRAVLEAKAQEVGAPLWMLGGLRLASEGLVPEELAPEGGRLVPEGLVPSLLGAHQVDNAALAALALRVWRRDFPEAALRAGAQRARWRGRMEKVGAGVMLARVQASGGEALWLDGAHNPHAARTLAQTMREQGEARQWSLVVALREDKKLAQWLRSMVGVVAGVVATTLPEGEGHACQAVAAQARALGMEAVSEADLERAISHAGTMAPWVMVAGSLRLVGEVLRLDGALCA